MERCCQHMQQEQLKLSRNDGKYNRDGRNGAGVMRQICGYDTRADEIRKDSKRHLITDFWNYAARADGMEQGSLLRATDRAI
jgi:hypothetical protein